MIGSFIRPRPKSLDLIALSLTPHPPSTVRRHEHRAFIVQFLLTFTIWLATVALLLVGLWRLWEPSPYSIAQDTVYISAFSSALPCGLFLALLFDLSLSGTYFRQISQRVAMFRALIRGELPEEVNKTTIQPAPLLFGTLQLPIQPMVTHTLDVSPLTPVIGIVTLPIKRFVRLPLWMPLLYILLFSQVMAMTLSNEFGFLDRFGFVATNIIIVATLVTVFGGLVGINIMYNLAKSPGQPVVIDEQGLIAQPTRRRPDGWRVRWEDIRGIACQAEEPLYGLSNETFFIVTDDRLIQWMTPIGDNGLTHVLLGLIVGHTGLPLRDIGPFNAELQRRRYHLRRLIVRRRRDNKTITPDLAAFADRYALTPRWYERVRLGLRPTALILGFVIPIITFVVIAQSLLSYRNGYIAGLPARIQRLNPDYSASLTSKAADWQLWPGSGTATFQPDGLQLAGNEVMAGMPLAAGDVAVEVTMLLTASADGDAAAGIALHGNGDLSRYVAFSIDNSDGNWALEPTCTAPRSLGSIRALDFVPSSPADPACRGRGDGAIRLTDPQNPHTYLLIARGDAYLVFIDGEYAGGYTDAAGTFPTTGTIGLFVESGAATFSDLRVYRLHPATFWEFV